jgi:dihydrofolate reductase
MSKLLYSATMSLDGFIAGPGGDMSWLSDHVGALDSGGDRLLDLMGALLIGRRTFDGDDPNAGTDSEGAFGGAWAGPSVVLTHRPPDQHLPDVTYATDLSDAVAIAQRAARERYVNVLGADVARQCLDAGLLDEILVFVVPVLLGDGTRLFDRPGRGQVPLTTVEPPFPMDGHWFRVDR